MKMKPIDYVMILAISCVIIYNGIAISKSMPQDPLQEDYQELVDSILKENPQISKETDLWLLYPELWSARKMIKESHRLHKVKLPLSDQADPEDSILRMRTDVTEILAELKSTTP